MAGQRLVDTVFSALSGGFTENNETVWGDPPDANLRGQLDGPSDPRFAAGITEANLDAFLDSPPTVFSARTGYNQEKHRWTRSLSAERLNELVNAQRALGRITDLRVLKRGVFGAYRVAGDYRDGGPGDASTASWTFGAGWAGCPRPWRASCSSATRTARRHAWRSRARVSGTASGFAKRAPSVAPKPDKTPRPF